MTNITQIATVASGIIELIETGKEVYQATVTAMDAIEVKGSLKGEDKKAWVLAFIKNFVYELGENWEKDRKSTRLNSSHSAKSRMPSSA